MTVVRTLGKNTLGDNNKMKVAMREYDMSTHDISTIFVHIIIRVREFDRYTVFRFVSLVL